MSKRLWSRRNSTVAALCGAAVFLLGCGGAVLDSDMIAYDLPEGAAQYTLEVETDGVTTEWTYNSARPEAPDGPETQPCMEEILQQPDVGDCRPEPLIFLRYDLGLELDNTARARGPHEIMVTGYYQERLSEPPQITHLMVEVSYDGGDSWQPAQTGPVDSGSATATIRYPADAEVVSLRVTGSDDAGNSVVQTMPEAYRLS